MSDSVRPHRRQPTRFPCPWDSPGKNTGVGCHFLLQCMKVKSESEVAQSCPTLSDLTDCSLPGSLPSSCLITRRRRRRRRRGRGRGGSRGRRGGNGLQERYCDYDSFFFLAGIPMLLSKPTAPARSAHPLHGGWIWEVGGQRISNFLHGCLSYY